MQRFGSQSLPQSKVDILLIEDSEADALLTKRSLLKSGLNNVLYHVWDGDEAMDFLLGNGAYAGTNRPRVILLDVNLPKRSGIELLAEIRSHEELKNIPVVMLTTSRSEADVIGALDAHANSFVTKPVTLDEFRQIIIDIEHYWTKVNLQP